MTRLVFRSTFAFLLLLLSFGPTARAQQPAKRPARALQRFAKPLSDICKLALDDGKLTIDREHWKRETQEDDSDKKQENKDPAVGPVGHIAAGVLVMGAKSPGMGSGKRDAFDIIWSKLIKQMGLGGSSLGRSPLMRSMMVANRQLAVSISLTDTSFLLSAKEINSPKRTLRVAQNTDGSMSIHLLNLDADRLLILRQDKSGTATLTQFAGGKATFVKDTTFLKLYGNNRKLLDETILPILKLNGVGLPPTGANPEVAAAAIQMLRASDAASQAAGLMRIEHLGSKNFKQRQQATETLKANYLPNASAIEQALASTTLTPEIKQRLKTIIDANKQARRHAQLVTGLDMLNQPDYLERLKQQAKTQADRDMIDRRLKSLKSNQDQ